MPNIRVGCGQITWQNVPETQVLEEIAHAGYEGAPAGPSSGQTPEQAAELYGKYNLAPAPGYLGANFWEKDQRDNILEQARQYAHFLRALGVTELYVASGGFGSWVAPSGRTRAQAAGHATPKDELPESDFERFADTLTAAAEITLSEGVRSCFHNHVGTVIETETEIEKLLSLTDPNVVFLGPDTGHLAWAGVDVNPFLRRHASRIRTIHLKDISNDVRLEGVQKEWDYATFAQNGIFAELGEGDVNIPETFEILDSAGFSGWVIVETDVTQKPSAFDSALASRNYLRTLGI